MSKRINVELQDDEYKLLKDTINGTISEYLDDACAIWEQKEYYQNLAHELMVVYNKVFGKTFSVKEKKEVQNTKDENKSTIKPYFECNLSDEELNNFINDFFKTYYGKDFKEIIKNIFTPRKTEE